MAATRSIILLLLVTTALASSVVGSKVRYGVKCSGGAMVVRVAAEGVEGVELEKWGALPGCNFRREVAYYSLTLSLDDDLACGTTRVRNHLTGETVYYHRVGVTAGGVSQVLLVKCRVGTNNSTLDNIVKRDVLPPEFVEPDFIEITSEVTGTAPIPILGVGVRQDGKLVGGQINVRPGTPLHMEVFLDDTSATIYGILMSYMEVTDTENKRETIIFNGCSVDPLLFENFVTTTGDYVSAKFRAFKFPETNYVLFRGTVDVCLDKCQGIACSNGQLGYGRRRRGVTSQPADPNKIFEVTMMTFLKVDESMNGTKQEATLTSGMEQAEDEMKRMVGGVEQAAEDLVQRVEQDMEKVLKGAEGALPWGRSVGVGHAELAKDETSSFHSRDSNEPVFIYYNAGTSHRLSFVYIMAAVLCILPFH